jgi:NAD(P)-dependent dehydrogenase (short-subunit alcohol dehydrogenase family)
MLVLFVGLWGIVNNAGIAGGTGVIEWLSMDDYRAAFEVNTLGMTETIRIFLPLVLKSKGRIVNITSIMGRLALLRPLMLRQNLPQRDIQIC